MTKRRDSINEARFSLTVHGSALSAAEIEAGLGIKATRMIHKGEELNRLPLIVAEEDEWMHTVPLTAPHGTDAELNSLLALLVEKKPVLEKLRADHTVTLRLYVQSDAAQMAYQLMPETLEKIVATGLPLDVSSLSWGEVGI